MKRRRCSAPNCKRTRRTAKAWDCGAHALVYADVPRLRCHRLSTTLAASIDSLVARVNAMATRAA